MNTGESIMLTADSILKSTEKTGRYYPQALAMRVYNSCKKIRSDFSLRTAWSWVKQYLDSETKPKCNFSKKDFLSKKEEHRKIMNRRMNRLSSMCSPGL